VVPERIEFWKSGWHRLHERVCYDKTDEGWTRFLLNP
jgi:pyridoxine/pyridoxamine 5'-phosphate oxidase